MSEEIKCDCWDKKMVVVPGIYPDVPEGMEMKLGHHPLCEKRPAPKKYAKLKYNGMIVLFVWRANQ